MLHRIRPGERLELPEPLGRGLRPLRFPCSRVRSWANFFAPVESSAPPYSCPDEACPRCPRCILKPRTVKNTHGILPQSRHGHGIRRSGHCASHAALAEARRSLVDIESAWSLHRTRVGQTLTCPRPVWCSPLASVTRPSSAKSAHFNLPFLLALHGWFRPRAVTDHEDASSQLGLHNGTPFSPRASRFTGHGSKEATLASGPWSSHWAVPASGVHQSAMMALAGWLQTDRNPRASQPPIHLGLFTRSVSFAFLMSVAAESSSPIR